MHKEIYSGSNTYIFSPTSFQSYMHKRFSRTVRIVHERVEADKRRVLLYRIERPSDEVDKQGKVDRTTVRYIIWPFDRSRRNVEVVAFDNEQGVNLFEQIILREHNKRIAKRAAKRELKSISSK